MVHGNRSDVHELRQIVLVRNVVPMPSDDIERRVVLLALEKLAAELVYDLPRFLFDVVFGDRVQEVSCVG